MFLCSYVVNNAQIQNFLITSAPSATIGWPSPPLQPRRSPCQRYLNYLKIVIISLKFVIKFLLNKVFFILKL